MKTTHIAMICAAILVAFTVYRCTNDGSTSRPVTTTQTRPIPYPNTVSYWKKWAEVRNTHDGAVAQLHENESVQDCIKCAEWGDWLAQQTLTIPQLDTDPLLVQLVIDFTAFYRLRANAFRQQAGLMQAALDLKARGDSGWTYVEAFVRGVAGDPFGVTTEMLDADKQLKNQGASFLQMSQTINTSYIDLRARRDQMRARLTAEYKIELPQ